MDLHQFYKEHYFFEATRRQHLRGALSIPIAIVVVLSGAIHVIAERLDYPFNNIEIIQLIVIIFALVAIGATIYFLFRSHYNYSYGYMATSKELKAYYEELLVEPDNENKLSSAMDELEAYIDSEYAKHTHLNSNNNDIKSAFLHKSSKWLMWAVAATIVSGFPYFVTSVFSSSIAKKQNPIMCKFINQGTNAMTKAQKPNPTPSKVIPPKQTNPPSTRPTPPPGRIIKEDNVPKKS